MTTYLNFIMCLWLFLIATLFYQIANANFYVKTDGVVVRADAAGLCITDYDPVMKNYDDQGFCHKVKTFQSRPYPGLGRSAHISGATQTACDLAEDVWVCDDSVKDDVYLKDRPECKRNSAEGVCLVANNKIQLVFNDHLQPGKMLTNPKTGEVLMSLGRIMSSKEQYRKLRKK